MKNSRDERHCGGHQGSGVKDEVTEVIEGVDHARKDYNEKPREGFELTQLL